MTTRPKHHAHPSVSQREREQCSVRLTTCAAWTKKPTERPQKCKENTIHYFNFDTVRLPRDLSTAVTCDHTAGHRVLGAQGRLSHHTTWWNFLFFIFYKKQLSLLQAFSILEYRVCAFTRVHDVHALSFFIRSERASRPQSSCEAHAHFISHHVNLINDVSKAFSYVYCVTTSFWSPSRLLSA